MTLEDACWKHMWKSYEGSDDEMGIQFEDKNLDIECNNKANNYL